MQARLQQEVTQIAREADDEADWQAAGFSSNAAWLAQALSSDHRTAVRIARTGEALRDLPALDHAMSTGTLTLDQVAAAVEHATPETDAELARVAVGKAPSEISLAARTLAPPVVADDRALYAERALSMTWTRGRRQLLVRAQLPLEQGLVFEQAIWDIAKDQRRADKQAGVVLEWQQSTADALVTLARHGGGKQRALHKRAGGCCQYPGCTARRELEAHHVLACECGGATELANLILLCTRHHKLLHDHHIHTSGHAERPVFTDTDGRAITTNQPHAPPR